MNVKSVQLNVEGVHFERSGCSVFAVTLFNPERNIQQIPTTICSNQALPVQGVPGLF